VKFFNINRSFGFIQSEVAARTPSSY